MISLLQGKIISNTQAEVVLLTSGGVGYKILVSPRAAEKCVLNLEQALETFLVVREDALELFGFENTKERELFKHFLSVSGVGPKTALHLLALGTVEDITRAVQRGDVAYLTKVSGIGKKTAERIVVDLKNKLTGAVSFELAASEGVPDSVADVIDGLIALGYGASEAREVAKTLDSKGKTSEQLLKEALQRIT
jgi:Holliday junction DNA helicase RuvA